MSKSAAEIIIEKFGGVSELARVLRHKYPTTVQGWKTRKIIPANRQQEVLDAAAAEKIDLTPADFFASRETGRAALKKSAA